LDDFLLGSVSKQVGNLQLNQFLDMCSDIGVPISSRKTFYPSTVMTFLGVELDTVAKEVRMSQEKIIHCTELIRQFLSLSKISLREIQSLIGCLSFVCQAVVPGQAFLRRLIDLTRGVRRAHHKIRLNQGVKADLNLWLLFMQGHNGKCFFLDNFLTPTHDIELYTDASAAFGYGAVFGNRWFYGAWEEWWKKQNIMLLELDPIVVAIEIWGHELKNRRLVLFTDNQALVVVLQKQTSKDSLTMFLIRCLVMTNNILLDAKHVPGVENGPADALSRLQVDKFHALCPGAETSPVAIPRLSASATLM
jgi:hypothetical protein